MSLGGPSDVDARLNGDDTDYGSTVVGTRDRRTQSLWVGIGESGGAGLGSRCDSRRGGSDTTAVWSASLGGAKGGGLSSNLTPLERKTAPI